MLFVHRASNDGWVHIIEFMLASGRGVSGLVKPAEGHKVLLALADLGGPGDDQPAGQARVLVGSASLLAAAGVKLSPDAEAHMASVQVRPFLCDSLQTCFGWSGTTSVLAEIPAITAPVMHCPTGHLNTAIQAAYRAAWR